VAAAALAASAASAAIIALGFTLGSWAIDFVAAARGGFLQDVAAYTPTAALRVFEQGLLRPKVLVVVLAVSLAGFWLSAIWLDTGRSLRSRLLATGALAAGVAVLAGVGGGIRSSWDLSEDRRNSFSHADETALRQIHEPLRVTVYLAAEDPRLTDLERSILTKLDRILPMVYVDYAANSRSGLFEGPEDHYGEVWYEMAGRKAMSRSTTEPIVLELIYDLAGVPAPEGPQEGGYSGYPLAARPKLAGWVFYLFWPLAAVSAWWLIRRQRS
jgi:hypothetical protein